MPEWAVKYETPAEKMIEWEGRILHAVRRPPGVWYAAVVAGWKEDYEKDAMGTGGTADDALAELIRDIRRKERNRCGT